MNSMFSSFDALCAQLLGQKVRSSLALTAMDCNTKRVLTAGDDSKVAEDKLIKNREGSSSRSVARKQEKKVPRFAPELDGLNCFETIVNYWDSMTWRNEVVFLFIGICRERKRQELFFDWSIWSGDCNVKI